MNKLQARTELARRLKERFGSRARQIVELSEEAYEGSSTPSLNLAVVLADDGYDPDDDLREAIDVAVDYDLGTDVSYVSRVRVASEREVEEATSPLARSVRTGGPLA